jgi:hypothetical protein
VGLAVLLALASGFPTGFALILTLTAIFFDFEDTGTFPGLDFTGRLLANSDYTIGPELRPAGARVYRF